MLHKCYSCLFDFPTNSSSDLPPNLHLGVPDLTCISLEPLNHQDTETTFMLDSLPDPAISDPRDSDEAFFNTEPSPSAHGKFSKVMFCTIVWLVVIGGPLLSVLSRTLGSLLGALGVSSLVLGLHLALYWMRLTKRVRIICWLAIARACALSLALPAFFAATSSSISKLGLSMHDYLLLAGDTALLGWAFPQGQLALFVETIPGIAPSDPLGKLIVEVLNLVYISFYWWGYSLLAIFAIDCIRTILRGEKKCRNARFTSWTQALWRLEMFSCTWALCFLVIFSVNMIVPAMSPRLYLQDEYKTNLSGFGLAGFTRSFLEVDNSYGAFPSGHVGESLTVGIAAYLLLSSRMKWYAIVSTAAGLLISFATLWLRYHYVMDIIAGSLVACWVLVLFWVAVRQNLTSISTCELSKKSQYCECAKCSSDRV